MSTVRCSVFTGVLSAHVRVPGSKSITNRALAIAAWADGTSLLRGALFAEDAILMVQALRTLGIRITLDEPGRAMEVTGCRGHLPVEEAELFCGNSGTVLRFLTALTATGRGEFRFDAAPRLRQRPVGELVSTLQELGAGVEYAETAGCPPYTLRAAGLEGGHVTLVNPPSSQMVSALLLAAPYAAADVFLAVRGQTPSMPYVRMTMNLMEHFGVAVLAGSPEETAGSRYVVPASQRYTAQTLAIEPDASAATYFLAAAAVAGGEITIDGMGSASHQGDAGFASVLEKMGCHVDQTASSTTVRRDPAAELHGIDIDLNAMPDVVPTLAVTALFADGPTTIRNVANLRLKESDRLAALGSELSKVGATIEVTTDGLIIDPLVQSRPAVLETHNDHRLAMSFALLGLRIPGITISGAECCAKTYPGFFTDWAAHVAPVDWLD